MRINDCRPEVRAFAVEMEKRLRKNDKKGGWRWCGTDWLLCRCVQELGELFSAIDRNGYNSGPVVRECADAANFLMMLADNAGMKSPDRGGIQK